MPTDLKRVVVVGAGVAGTRAAETLRQDGYDGELTIVGSERHAPYHRPPLSKKLLSGKVHRAGIDLAPQFEMDARVLRGASAVGLDVSARTVQVRDGNDELALQFDGLVIASGAVAREWPSGPVPDGVLVLRTVEDCLAIRERLALGSSGRHRRRRIYRRRGRRDLPVGWARSGVDRAGRKPAAGCPGQGVGATLGRLAPRSRGRPASSASA